MWRPRGPEGPDPEPVKKRRESDGNCYRPRPEVKPPAPSGTCGLTLRINGTAYEVRPIRPDVGSGVRRAFTLAKADGIRLRRRRDEHGPSCDCPDYEFRPGRHRPGRLQARQGDDRPRHPRLIVGGRAARRPRPRPSTVDPGRERTIMRTLDAPTADAPAIDADAFTPTAEDRPSLRPGMPPDDPGHFDGPTPIEALGDNPRDRWPAWTDAHRYTIAGPRPALGSIAIDPRKSRPPQRPY